MAKRADILIVDDEEDIRALIAGILEDEGYTVHQAGSAKRAHEVFTDVHPDLVVLDIWLQGSDTDGIGILEVLKKNTPGLPVLMISGHGTIETAVTAIKKGAYDFIEKPFKSDRLLLMVERALEAAALRRENADLRAKISEEHAGALSGRSESITALGQLIEKTAKANSRVLIQGEAGAGKNLTARLIHAGSDRSEKGFDVLSAAGTTPDNLETNLRAAIERVKGGTIILDEIADLPLQAQAKLVRILQDQKIAAGDASGDMLSFDVRFIATTARDLQSLIESKQFREDLYYRLNVVSVDVPPLRNRVADIPLLAQGFIEKFSGGAGVTLDGAAMAALERYKWPGNVRQLRNVIEGALIVKNAHGEAVITKADLPPEVSGLKKAADAPEPEISLEDMIAMPLREARELFEKNYLAAQMERFEGSVAKMANFVGMERSALHRKLKSLDISSDKDEEGEAGSVVPLRNAR